MSRRFFTSAALAVFLAPLCFPADPSIIPLPSPKKVGALSVETALATRRSVRAYTKESLTIADLGQLLWAAQGLTSPDGKPTAPSAMHRYPLEIAVVAQHVDSLANGAYRYMPASHSLELLTPANTLPQATQAANQIASHSLELLTPAKSGQLLAKATAPAQVQSAPAGRLPGSAPTCLRTKHELKGMNERHTQAVTFIAR